MLDVYIIGDGAELPGLQLKCRNETITNVNFIDRVNFAQLKLHITALDILFAQIGEDYATAIPSKIFEYIAAGRKILLGLPEGPAQDLFGRFAGVYIFAAEDRASFNEALSKCIDEPFTFSDVSENRNVLASEFLRESSARNIAEEILTVYNQK
jgi:glycosyltransferase involved in cell wall biosynthesis